SGLDDDNTVPWFMFDDKVYEPFMIQPDDVEGCIETWRTIPDPYAIRTQAPPRRKFFGRAAPVSAPPAGTPTTKRQYGGTDYLVAIEAVLEYCKDNDLFAADQPPVFVPFIT